MRRRPPSSPPTQPHETAHNGSTDYFLRRSHAAHQMCIESRSPVTQRSSVHRGPHSQISRSSQTTGWNSPLCLYSEHYYRGCARMKNRARLVAGGVVPRLWESTTVDGARPSTVYNTGIREVWLLRCFAGFCLILFSLFFFSTSQLCGTHQRAGPRQAGTTFLADSTRGACQPSWLCVL